MPQRQQRGHLRRRLTALLSATVLLTAVTACTEGPDGSQLRADGGMITIAPSSQPAGKVVQLGGGARVIFADAPADGSELTVRTSDAPPNPGGRRSLATPVELTLTGGDLGRGATLEFPLPKSLRSAAADAVGIATYDEDAGAWIAQEAVIDRERGLVSVATTHFSWWQPWTWDWAAVGATVNQGVGQVVGKRAPQASCRRGQPTPEWVAQVVGVSNDPAVAVRGCVEGENGALAVELVNNLSCSGCAADRRVPASGGRGLVTFAPRPHAEVSHL